MKEQLITFDTAKLAKEKGFWLPCYKCYDNSQFLQDTSNDEDVVFKYDYRTLPSKDKYLAPTQSLLQKWLREKHNIYAREELVSSELGSKEIFAPSITTEFRDWDNENYCNYSFNNYYELPEEAIEKGLQEALKLIN